MPLETFDSTATPGSAIAAGGLQVNISLDHPMTLYAYSSSGCTLSGVLSLTSNRDITTRKIVICFVEHEYFEFGVPRLNKLVFATSVLLYSATFSAGILHHLPFKFILPYNLHTTVFARFNSSRYELVATVKLRKGLRTIDITRSIDMAFYPVPYQLQPSKSARVVDKPYTTTHNLGWATVEVAIQNAFIASGSSPAKVSVVIKPAEDSGCIYYFVRLTGEFTEFLEYTRTDGTIIYADQPKSICNISNVHPKWHEPQPLISGANIDMEFEYRLPMLVTETSAPLCQNWATESTPANMPNFEKDPYVYYDVTNTHIRIKHALKYCVEFWDSHQAPFSTTNSIQIRVVPDSIINRKQEI